MSSDDVITLSVADNSGLPPGSRNLPGQHTINKFQAAYCILAVTPGVHNSIDFKPNLNGLYHQFPQRMPMGSIIKTFAIYDKPWWREKGFNGIASVTDMNTFVGQTFDITTPSSPPCIMGFILGKRARLWQQVDQAKKKEIVLAEYAKLFESDEALNATDFFEKDWLSDTFIGGSGGVANCGVTTTYHEVLRKPIHR